MAWIGAGGFLVASPPPLILTSEASAKSFLNESREMRRRSQKGCWLFFSVRFPKASEGEKIPCLIEKRALLKSQALGEPLSYKTHLFLS